jgi:ribosomal protein L12E/L44/L45/RPP1/RPP2
LHHQKSSPAKGDHDEDALVEDGVAGSELYEQDISEQKKLIADLKQKRAMAAAATASTSKQQQDQDDEMSEEDEEEDEEEEDESEGPSKLKRARPDEEEPLKFQFKEPETEERQIATNRRVGRFGMEPRTKSIAWGLAAFAVGMGAV